MLPALLATVGSGIDRWSVRRAPDRPVGEGRWHRIASAVMRRPVPVAAAAVALLVVLGLPALRMQLGMPDPRVLPEQSESRRVVEGFERDFAGNEGFPLFVLATGIGDALSRSQEIHQYASALSMVSGVARVDAQTGSYAQGGRIFEDEQAGERFAGREATYLSVVPAPAVQPFSPRAERLFEDLRGVPSPFADVSFGGETPGFVAAKAALFSRLPLAATLIGLITFGVLFIAFGSVLLPLKAIALNILSLTATFGAMVWVFQDGHLADLLNFTPREAVDIFNPILMFAIAFGISMDYEVFMLSRVKEEYERTGDNTGSVAAGLERSGRIVTAAALLIAAVFLAQVSSGISIIKMFGLGLALAVLVDAFIVRATLLPAFMRIAGRLNWWAPESLRRLHDRVGFREAELASSGASSSTSSGTEPNGMRPRRERPLVAVRRNHSNGGLQ
jgi:putative drug exporter of the RND superfamily